MVDQTVLLAMVVGVVLAAGILLSPYIGEIRCSLRRWAERRRE